MGQQLLLDFDQELDEGIPVEDSYGQTPARNLSPSVTAATAASGAHARTWFFILRA